MKRRIWILPVAAAFLSLSCPVTRGEQPAWLAEGRHAMVASDSAEASQAGLDILKAGGNAIDAAAATSFALGVTRPYSTGLGGGGFMIIRFVGGRTVVLDYRETAPARASAEMFVEARKRGGITEYPSRYGYLAAAVPGVLAGQHRALSQFGTFDLARAVAPAIRLAESGFEIDQHFVASSREVLKTYEKHPDLKETSPFIWKKYLGGGALPKPGDRLIQPELAKLLREVAEHGPPFFYQGPVAEAIDQAMRRHGGVMTMADLGRYEVRQREALRVTYRGHEIITMPPPSSGGVAIAETLNILEQFDLRGLARQDPALAVHYQVEAMKHAFADRARWLGDTNDTSVSAFYLTSKSYAADLAKRIDEFHAAGVATYGCSQLPDDAGTSHYCVVDRWGNVVVATETINTVFGSLATIAEWGLILNNEMDDFSAEPDRANAFRLIQSERNAPAPGKRPLSSMAPTIVLKDGEPLLMLGASGGPRIISSVLNVLLCVLEYNLPLDQAIVEPRPHHQWQPDELFFDSAPLRQVERGLVNRGHKISDQRKTGIVQAIMKGPSGWLGASDPRKGGRPAGY
ncbi:MAG: gamma-glutamyltransferase [Phycisphaerales bacterium]|nr:MAG: gamma-glutamyltransferase [Phycisphaerales bacterium]